MSLKKENLSLLITIPSTASQPLHTNIASDRSANPHTSLGDARMYLVIFREKFFGIYGEEKIDYWPPKTQSLKGMAFIPWSSLMLQRVSIIGSTRTRKPSGKSIWRSVRRANFRGWSSRCGIYSMASLFIICQVRFIPIV